MEAYLKCHKCGKQTIDSTEWWLNRWLKVQNYMTSNKPHYPYRVTFWRQYIRVQKHIESLDPWYERIFN